MPNKRKQFKKDKPSSKGHTVLVSETQLQVWKDYLKGEMEHRLQTCAEAQEVSTFKEAVDGDAWNMVDVGAEALDFIEQDPTVATKFLEYVKNRLVKEKNEVQAYYEENMAKTLEEVNDDQLLREGVLGTLQFMSAFQHVR